MLSVNKACHSTTVSVDNLGELTSKSRKGINLERIKLQRRKCTKMIANVVRQAFKNATNVTRRNSPIIATESTDVSSKRLLIIVIRHHNGKENKIVLTFVDFITLEEATGKYIIEAIDKCIESTGLNMKEYIGHGCDGSESFLPKKALN